MRKIVKKGGGIGGNGSKKRTKEVKRKRKNINLK
jgi:hypothetical protein